MLKFESILHIGLGKCASTEFQHIFNDSGNYSYHSLENLVEMVNRSLVENNLNPKAAIETIKQKKLDFQNFNISSSGINVFSSEGITFSFISQMEYGHLIPLKQKILANMLKNLSKKVLLIIRDPRDWMLSGYAQYIKEGGFLPIEEYMIKAEDTVKNNLDIDYIIKIFEECDFDVKVLPIELIQFSETYFWEEYEKVLGVEKPACPQFKRVNSTNYASMQAHIKLNTILERLEYLVLENKIYQQDQTLEIVKNLSFSRQWGTRTALRGLNLKELSILNDFLGLEAVTEPKIPSLDQNYLNHIDAKFLVPLRDIQRFPYQEILQNYEKSLQSLK